MTASRLYVARVPVPVDLPAYRELLRTRVYPAADRLEDEQLIDTFFLVRRGATLEICVGRAEVMDTARVTAILREAGLAIELAALSDLSPEEVDRLDAVTHLMRVVHEAGDPTYAFNQALHYACAQAGFEADAQAYWHIVQALVWLHTHFARSDPSQMTLQLADETLAGLRGMLRL